MAQPKTADEAAVEEVRRASRPRRNVQVFAFVGITVLLTSAAIYSKIKGGGEQHAPVKERAGAKADPTAPSPSEYRKMVEQQSGAPLSGGSAAPVVAQPTAETSPSIAPAAGASASPPMPPPGPVASPSRKELEAFIAAQRGAGGQGQPASIDLPLPSSSRIPPGGMGEVPEAKMQEAAYMTAPTEVYIRNKRAENGSRGIAIDQAAPTEPGASRSALSSALANLPSLDPGSLSRIGNKPDSDTRIAARIGQTEKFAASSARPKEPLTATPSPALPYIAEGDAIPAVLTRAVSTDLPGQIEAVVTQNVYDSFGRGQLLVPKGTRAIGIYNQGVAVGQDRLQVAFTRLLFPNGASIALESVPGADRTGASGVTGKVDNHFFRIFSTAIAVAAIGYAVERRIARDQAGQASSGSTVNVIGSGSTTPGTVAAQTFGNVTERILDRTANIGPTIYVPSGTRINIQVTRDLALDPKVVL